jgi:hypothetical protein
MVRSKMSKRKSNSNSYARNLVKKFLRNETTTEEIEKYVRGSA